MNCITLIGTLQKEVTYHCTEQGQDLVRLQLGTINVEGLTVHHCRAWGPAALDLHQHLSVGDQLLIRGELKYRPRKLKAEQIFMVPAIEIKRYTYLGKGGGASSRPLTYR